MVNSAPSFGRQPNVINGFSDLILELYGPEAGDHAQTDPVRNADMLKCRPVEPARA
jgi:hypothetical protein